MKCRSKYRIRTPAETGYDLCYNELAAYYGAEVDLQHTHYGYILTTQVSIYAIPPEWIEEWTDHSWVDTGGMLRSYCKHCDSLGEWDRTTCQYVAKS